MLDDSVQCCTCGILARLRPYSRGPVKVYTCAGTSILYPQSSSADSAASPDESRDQMICDLRNVMPDASVTCLHPWTSEWYRTLEEGLRFHRDRAPERTWNEAGLRSSLPERVDYGVDVAVFE